MVCMFYDFENGVARACLNKATEILSFGFPCLDLLMPTACKIIPVKERRQNFMSSLYSMELRTVFCELLFFFSR